MRRLYLFFVVTLVTLGFMTQAPAQPTADNGMGASPPSDYFNQITLFSDGRITRFRQMPIRVNISPTLKALPYLAEIRHAMQTWETVSEREIRFEETELPEKADIRVTSTHSGRLQLLDKRRGSAELTRLAQDTHTVSSTDDGVQSVNTEPPSNTEVDFAVEVILGLEGDGTIGELSQAEMRTVCLHEFGHAIGLWGHSSDANDVCHAMATARKPTQRDINTLLKLYNTPLHTAQHEVAIAELERELQTNPRHARTHYLLGSVYFDKGDMAPAIASFQICLGIDSDFERAREKLIQAYEKTGQRAEAIRLIEQSIVNQRGGLHLRGSASSYNFLGTLYYRQGEEDKAIQAFEGALERSPHYKAAKRNLHQLLREKAFSALKISAFEEATAYFEKAIHLDPLNVNTYRLMGDGCAHISRFSEAITYYRKALNIEPDNKAAQENLAYCYINYGVTLRNDSKWDLAIRAYQNALELLPTYQLARKNIYDVFCQKANAYRQSGRYSDAIATYRELQKLHPDDTDIANLLGELYLKVRDYPAAISAFHKVYVALPTDKQARHNLIAAYQQYALDLSNRKAHSAAVEQLHKAVDLIPTDINLRLNLAQAYQHIGGYEQARSELEQVLVHSPDNAKARMELVNLQIRRGNALMNRKKYAAAVAVFEGIPASEKTVDMYNMIGYLYLVQAKHLKALEAFGTVLAKHPKDSVAFQNLLSLESQLELVVDKARAEAQKASDTSEATAPPHTVEVTPDPTAEKLSRVQCALVRCLMRRNQPENAMEKYRRALNAKPYTSELQALLIDAGRQLANQFYKQSDTDSYETIVRWATDLDSNFIESLDSH